MRNEDIINKLENLTLPDITLESHRYELEASLLEEYASIQAMYDRKGLSSWLRTVRVSRRVWIAVAPVIIALVVVLILQLTGLFTSPSGVLSKAYATMERIESYRVVSDGYIVPAYPDKEPTILVHYEAEYASPSRYRIVNIDSAGYTSFEMIIIENQIYYKGYDLLLEFLEPRSPDDVAEGFPSKDRTLEMLDLLVNVERFKDEYIDGTLCYHYRGTLDMDKYLEKARLRFLESRESIWERIREWEWVDEDQKERELEEYWAMIEELWRRTEITRDYWIGKDDYLIRQDDTVFRPLPDPLDGSKGLSIGSTSKYSDFNEEIVIESPLTETGELEEGWHETSMDSWLQGD